MVKLIVSIRLVEIQKYSIPTSHSRTYDDVIGRWNDYLAV